MHQNRINHHKMVANISEREASSFYPSNSAAPQNYGGTLNYSARQTSFQNAWTSNRSTSNQIESSTNSVMQQLFSQASFELGDQFFASNYHLYLVVHKVSLNVVAFGKFLKPKPIDYFDEMNSFKLIYLNKYLSSNIFHQLKNMIEVENDFLDVAPIDFGLILNAPCSVESLVDSLINLTVNWDFFFKWSSEKIYGQSIYANLGFTINFLNELKFSEQFMHELNVSADLIAFSMNQFNNQSFDSVLDESNMICNRVDHNCSTTDYFDCSNTRYCTEENEFEAKLDNLQRMTEILYSAKKINPKIYKVQVEDVVFPSCDPWLTSNSRSTSLSSAEACLQDDEIVSESLIKQKIFEEASELYRIDPTYTIEQYEGFVRKNQQKKKRKSSETCQRVFENSKRLHISNIPFKWDEKHLEDEFAPFGEVDNCTIIRTSDHLSQVESQIPSRILFQLHEKFQIPIKPLIDEAKEQILKTRSRGYGFITFKHSRDAEMAKLLKHDTWVCDLDKNGKKVYNPQTNRKIECNWAAPKKN